jgi:hypothetical protein
MRRAMLDENTTTDASADSLTVEEAPVGNGDAGVAATGDSLVARRCGYDQRAVANAQ